MDIFSYLFGMVLFLIASYFLYKKFKKDIQKGKCAACNLSDGCKSIKKIEIKWEKLFFYCPFFYMQYFY